jgi:hypothetical protein
VCLLLSLASSTIASAQSRNAQAETLFRQARDLMQQKKYAEACAAFESSQKLDPAATTQFSLGVCQELAQKLATAWGVFIDFERTYRATTDATAKELLPKARERAQKLEARLSKLTIVAKATPGLAITLDGEELDSGAWNQPLPVDGGEHVVIAKLAKHTDVTQKITVGVERDNQTVTIGELAPIAEPATPVTPDPVATPVVSPPPPEGRSLVAPIAFVGGAVAFGGAALGFELWGRSMHDDAQATLDNGDAMRANELQDGANLRRYLAQGFGVAAIGCAIVSVVLFVRGGGTEPADTTALRLVPTATDDHAGLSLVGGW